MGGEVVAGLFEPFEGPDLVEPLADLPGGQLAAPEQRLVECRQVGRGFARHPVEGPPGEDAEAVVQVLHAGGPAGLVVGHEASLGKLDVARIPPVLVSEDRHERRPTARGESALDGPVVARQVRVAVEHEERFSEKRKGPLDRAGGTEGSGPVEGVFDLEAEPRAIARVLPDHLSPIPGAIHHPLHAVAPEQPHLVGDERLAVHIHQGLGDRVGQRPEPRGPPSPQNRDRIERLAHDWATTLVPSKSKRNRTSWSPASRMAAPSRTLSSASKIRKPTAPAPTTLPPSAPFAHASAYHCSMWSLLILAERRFLCSQWTFISSANCVRSPFSSASRLLRPSSLTKWRLAIISASDARLFWSCSRRMSDAVRE